jgi:23S rRNA (uracil1939-C5)-methyltransferase
MLKKNDTVELEVTSVTNLGFGAGRTEGEPVVFVPGAVTGDVVRARIVKVARGYCIGRLESLTAASELREADQLCKAPPTCGGCPYRFLKYDEELRLKRGNVASEFRKAGLSGAQILPVSFVSDGDGKPVIYRYRNKAQFRFCVRDGAVSAGIYASGTHRVAGDFSCPLQPEIFSTVADAVCRFAGEAGLTVYDEQTGTGLLRHLYIRASRDLSQICVCIVINGNDLPGADRLAGILSGSFPAVCGLTININRSNSNVILGDVFRTVWGKDGITDVFRGRKLEVSMASFYQVNHDAAELLCDTAAKLLAECAPDSGGTFVDLYCGIGTLGLSLADPDGALLGVEIEPEAVENARRNALVNGFLRARFIRAGSEEIGGELRKLTSRDTLCVDPPRRGCDPVLLDEIDASRVSRLLYISCNPATLARDAARLCASGWKLSQIRPVDLFPRTGHVETVVLMTKK